MSETQNLRNKKYISLETYRKNGISIRTPVWFVILDDIIHVVTREKTGKIKIGTDLKSNQVLVENGGGKKLTLQSISHNNKESL